jgi:hypothetical protein
MVTESEPPARPGPLVEGASLATAACFVIATWRRAKEKEKLGAACLGSESA